MKSLNFPAGWIVGNQNLCDCLIEEIKIFSNFSVFHFLLSEFCEISGKKSVTPISVAFSMINLFLSLFFVYFYWISLFRRIYSMKEVPLTYTTYCVSSLRQLFYCFLCLYSFIFLSFITQYWRLPIEFLWGLNNQSWFSNLYEIVLDYPLKHNLV
jgi:hypothetical protein